jgi:hypothetical protein
VQGLRRPTLYTFNISNQYSLILKLKFDPINLRTYCRIINYFHLVLGSGNFPFQRNIYYSEDTHHAPVHAADGEVMVCRRRGRSIAQAVSPWLPTAAARVRSRVWSSGICGGQSGAGADFLRLLRFPLPIFIPPIAPQSPSSIIWGWYNRPEVSAVQGT